MPGAWSPRPFPSNTLGQVFWGKPAWLFGPPLPWLTLPQIATSGATSVTLDFTQATVGEQMFAFVGLSDVQAATPTAPSGWTILLQGGEGTTGAASSRLICYTRRKQVGDTTQTFSWGTACGYAAVGAQYPGLDPNNPTEGAVYLAHSSGTTYPTGTVTPTAANRWIVSCYYDRNTTSTGSWTPDAAQVERIDFVSAANPWSVMEIADTNGPVTKAAHTYTASSITSSHGGSIAFAIIPSTASPAATLPPAPRRRLWPLRRVRSAIPPKTQQATPPPQTWPPTSWEGRAHMVRATRSHGTPPLPQQAAPPPPSIPPTSRMPRTRALWLAHGHGSRPPAVQSGPPPTRAGWPRAPWVPPRGHSARPPLDQTYPPARRVRPKLAQTPPRPRAAMVTPPQAAPTPPPWVAPASRTRARLVRAWRSQRGGAAPAQLVPPLPSRPVRTRWWLALRGHVAVVVPPQAIGTPPPYPPRGLRQRARIVLAARARIAQVVPPQVVLVPPAWVPGFSRHALARLAAARRRTAFTPPASAWLPQGTRRPARVQPPLSRRRSVAPPAGQASPPAPQRQGRRFVRRPAGHVAQVTPPQVVVVPPARAPQPARVRRVMIAVSRRRPGTWFTVAVLCETPRPSSGTTSRPSSGTTAYGTAMTSRPSSGVTSRPNTGDTPVPC